MIVREAAVCQRHLFDQQTRKVSNLQSSCLSRGDKLLPVWLLMVFEDVHTRNWPGGRLKQKWHHLRSDVEETVV